LPEDSTAAEEQEEIKTGGEAPAQAGPTLLQAAYEEAKAEMLKSEHGYEAGI